MPLPHRSRSTQASAAKRSSAPAKRPAAPLPQSLVALRAGFLAAIARDTPGSDLPRYTEVLDDLLSWGASHGDRVAACLEPTTAGVISFAPVAGTVGPRWSMRVVRGDAPVMELVPAPGAQQEAERNRVRELFNAHSRVALGAEDRLRIGFGALKNPTARGAVLALLDGLVEGARTTEAAALPA